MPAEVGRASALESEQLENVYSRVSRHIIPLLLLAYIVAYLDRVNVGFA